MVNKLSSVFRGMIYVLPAVLFFSYQPLMHFGSSESMNFEISLPLIWLVVFDVLVIVMGCRRRGFWRGIWKRWMWLLLPVWLSVSVLWSLNSLRGLLTAGIVWLIYLAIYGFFEFRHLFTEVGFREKFWKVFFGSSLVVCAWCWLQCVLDLSGVPREASLMCAGCTYEMFGFPHPDGFAIEPQFMGNLLLAPAIISGWMLIRKQNNNNLKRKRSRGVDLTTGQADSAPNYSSGSSSVPVVKSTTGSHFLCSKLLLFCFFIVSFTLFLTFSRGAIYAFVVGMVVLTVWMVVRAGKERGVIAKRVGVTWVSVILAFGLTLCVQGVMAAASLTNDTFQSGVAKVLNHLTLGVVDIREPENTKITEVEVVENSVENFGDDVRQEAAFDGYVAESTDTRLRLSGAAVEVWSGDLKTALFGVGLGGAGQALYVNGLSPAPKEIVQNQYASLLLETGVVGVGLVVFSLVLVVRALWRSPWRVMLLSLLVAYGITLLFFSGLPNALQIYLLPAVIYAISLRKKLVS